MEDGRERKWTVKECVALIQMWGEVPSLWNIKHPNYFKKDIRKMETEKLAERFNCSALEVTKKLGNLRTYYNKEASKVKASNKSGSTSSGSGTADVYVSKWPFYSSLHNVLHDQRMARKSTGNLNSEDIEIADRMQGSEDFISSEYPVSHCTTLCPANSKTPTSYNQTCKRQRVSPVEKLILETSLALQKAADKPKTLVQNDEFEIYGRYIANELRMIQDSSVRDLIKFKIGQVIFESKAGGLVTRTATKDTEGNIVYVLQPG